MSTKAPPSWDTSEVPGLRSPESAWACAQSLYHIRLFVTPWNVAHQAPLSMGFSWQEYWSGFPFLPPGDLPDPGIEYMSPASPALQPNSLLLSHKGSPWRSWILKNSEFGRQHQKSKQFPSGRIAPLSCSCFQYFECHGEIKFQKIFRKWI